MGLLARLQQEYSASDPKVSRIILQQLGGSKFLAMTGARNLTYSDKTLSMQLPRNPKNIKGVHITLNSRDEYDVE
jgi:hypothetical protein